MYRSREEATRAFDVYARIEPRLRPLWELCRRASRPNHDGAEDEQLEVDEDDGWCAEDYFHREVKPVLLLLVGSHRGGAAHELHSVEAYDAIYDLLLNWALNRSCVCCMPQRSWQRGEVLLAAAR